jgi:putative addiction module component (TIGR02574 family)
MTVSMDDLRKLPIPERLELVESLWDSIAADADLLPLTEKQAEELDQRLADHDANPAVGTSWDEVRERMLKNR